MNARADAKLLIPTVDTGVKPATAGDIEKTLEISFIKVEAMAALLRSIALTTDNRDIKTLCKHGAGQAEEVANDLDLLRDQVETAGVAGVAQ
ncbi:hypothetical protein ACEN9F_30465 [Duganella sp. CT11-25]|uniref:hypothetical protein n=1 Tax=unclassified Duganella TaxID=2636909 RepID=UPI0039B09298